MNSEKALELLTIAYVAQTKKWYEDHPEYTMPNWDGTEENWDEFAEIKNVNVNGVVVNCVDHQGGGEGSGEHMHVVFSFTDADGTVEFWRKDGRYFSFDGSDWDGDFRQVNAVQRLVTFYE